MPFNESDWSKGRKKKKKKKKKFSYNKLENTNHVLFYLSYLPNPSAWAGYDTRSVFFLKRSLTGLNSEFSFS